MASDKSSKFPASIMIDGDRIEIIVSVTFPEKFRQGKCTLVSDIIFSYEDDIISHIPGEDTVYLIHATGTSFYKIGHTCRSPLERMSELQTGNHTELNLIATCPGGISFETKLHQYFERNRNIGEWFNFNDRDLNSVKQLMINVRKTRAIKTSTSKSSSIHKETLIDLRDQTVIIQRVTQLETIMTPKPSDSIPEGILIVLDEEPKISTIPHQVDPPLTPIQKMENQIDQLKSVSNILTLEKLKIVDCGYTTIYEEFMSTLRKRYRLPDGSINFNQAFAQFLLLPFTSRRWKEFLGYVETLSKYVADYSDAIKVILYRFPLFSYNHSFVEKILKLMDVSDHIEEIIQYLIHNNLPLTPFYQRLKYLQCFSTEYFSDIFRPYCIQVYTKILDRWMQKISYTQHDLKYLMPTEWGYYHSGLNHPYDNKLETQEYKNLIDKIQRYLQN